MNIKRYFVTGLVIILPAVITFVILGFLLRLLTNPFEGLTFAILDSFGLIDKTIGYISSTALIMILSRLLILVVIVGVTLLIGFIARWFFIHEIIKLSDWVFHRIPLVNKIYRASQDTVKTLFHEESRTFKQVVLVPFPQRPGLSLGLITTHAQAESSDASLQNLVSVFVPGTPNPTVGFLLLLRPEQITPIDLPVDEAMKYIISCGVMLPKKVSVHGA